MFTFNPAAHAANCWNGSPPGLSFGTVTPGVSSATSTRLTFTCNNYDGQPEYVRACLKLMANDPIPMSQNEPSTTPLYFSLYSLYDLRHPLSQNSDVYAQIDMSLASGQGNVEHDIPLIGKINPGQSNISAGSYYDYATGVQIRYASASSMQSLPSCSEESGTLITTSAFSARRAPPMPLASAAACTRTVTPDSFATTANASAMVCIRMLPMPSNGRLTTRRNSIPATVSRRIWWSTATYPHRSGRRRGSIPTRW